MNIVNHISSVTGDETHEDDYIVYGKYVAVTSEEEEE